MSTELEHAPCARALADLQRERDEWKRAHDSACGVIAALQADRDAARAELTALRALVILHGREELTPTQQRDAARAELADANRYASSLRHALDLVLDALMRMPAGSLATLDTAAIEEAKRALAGGMPE